MGFNRWQWYYNKTQHTNNTTHKQNIAHKTTRATKDTLHTLNTMQIQSQPLLLLFKLQMDFYPVAVVLQ
jgi:hypothetical protein